MWSKEEVFLEELFRGCKKTFRILRLFIANPDEAFTKYRIEKEALVYDAEVILDRLVKLGIVKILNTEPRLYRLNSDMPVVKALRTFLREVKYL